MALCRGSASQLWDNIEVIIRQRYTCATETRETANAYTIVYPSSGRMDVNEREALRSTVEDRQRADMDHPPAPVPTCRRNFASLLHFPWLKLNICTSRTGRCNLQGQFGMSVKAQRGE
jgi:hypothetical protein